MKNVSCTYDNQKMKVVIITALYVTASLIMASGVLFGIYSYFNDVSFLVINTNVHGMIFGMVVGYLGLRYFLLVKKLEKEVYKPTSNFSWENFKKKKK